MDQLNLIPAESLILLKLYIKAFLSFAPTTNYFTCFLFRYLILWPNDLSLCHISTFIINFEHSTYIFFICTDHMPSLVSLLSTLFSLSPFPITPQANVIWTTLFTCCSHEVMQFSCSRVRGIFFRTCRKLSSSIFNSVHTRRRLD